MRRNTPKLVRSLEDVLENIVRFASEVRKETLLQERLTHVHAWYATRTPDGNWAFGPSKFVGYRANEAKQYIRTAATEGGAHGGKTERVLSEWFHEIDLQTRLGRELGKALGEFLAEWDRAPRKSARINLLRSDLDNIDRDPLTADSEILDRISIDPQISGGRPCIKGTRVRVSDIVDMIAHGATESEILADYSYLAHEDIAAALLYAAHATDHRVIRAA